MPNPSEFEEKEFEYQLYAELLGGLPAIWAPGLVLEHYLGFDIAMQTGNSGFWRSIGCPAPLRGATMSSHKLGALKRQKGFPVTRQLPAFKANLFLQAKRPERMIRRTAEMQENGLQTPYWRFKTREHQQKSLEILSKSLGHRALVAYVAPAFDTLPDLYRHIDQATLSSHCTWCKASRLKDHSQWAYDSPGTTGLACSDPVYFDDGTLNEWIDSETTDLAPSEFAELMLSSADQFVTCFRELSDVRATEFKRRVDLISAWEGVSSQLSFDSARVVKSFLISAVASSMLGTEWLLIE